MAVAVAVAARAAEVCARAADARRTGSGLMAAAAVRAAAADPAVQAEVPEERVSVSSLLAGPLRLYRGTQSSAVSAAMALMVQLQVQAEQVVQAEQAGRSCSVERRPAPAAPAAPAAMEEEEEEGAEDRAMASIRRE